MKETQTRRQALKRAEEAWDKAPATIKVMAGAYVAPILALIHAVGNELDTIQAAIDRLEIGPGVGHE